MENPGDVEVLILSGDICVAADMRTHDAYGIMDNARSDRFHKFFRNCSDSFPHVIYVVGNHEHYHGDFTTTIPILREKTKDLSNFNLLDKESIKIGDLTFVGGTMWTNMNNEDPLTLYHIKSMMNDFRTVTNADSVVNFRDGDGKFHTRQARFSPEDAVEDHKKFMGYLQSVIEGKNDEKFVVCTHHTPSHRSCHPRYADDQLMNGGYHTALDEYIEDHPQIKLWTHGHTHERYDYEIGSTRIICNPRGYICYEDIADTFELKIVEV